MDGKLLSPSSTSDGLHGQEPNSKECTSDLSPILSAPIKCVPGYPVTAVVGSSSYTSTATSVMPSVSTSMVKRPRFYFESDTLALKSNPDYCQLLKTLAVLEAQKMQAIRDIEVLLHAQARAEKDPYGFLESLKDSSLEPLPKRQLITEMPNIEWSSYIDSLQQVAKQSSSIYLNTRRQSKPRPSLAEKHGTAKTTKKDSSKSATYGQQWTVEEQARFEELLKVYPPEPVERRRFQKIAKALGTRTTQQVATHVQKYFIKLANAGLPVPGRMPNISKYPKKKGKGKRSLNRPSTFFSTLTPHILMKEYGSPSTSSGHDASTCNSSAEESFTSEAVFGGRIRGEEEEEEDEEENGGEGEMSSSASPQPPPVVRCERCASTVDQGVYWQCSDCDEVTPTHLCNDCINSDYHSEYHSPSHNMQLLSLAPPHTFLGRQDHEPSDFVDKDYISFATLNSGTGYNYLDPNFYPAS